MKILLLDNYDSFTYNLFHYLEDLHQEVEVLRNDKLTIQEVDQYHAIVFSPGPGLPKDAGLMPEIIETYKNKKAMLGICLGMQAICEAEGSELYNLSQVYHGVSSNCQLLAKDVIFESIPAEFEVWRYHSWAVPEPLPQSLQALARATDDQALMAVKHKDLPIWGFQYHPESILTPNGKKMLQNWLRAIS